MKRNVEQNIVYDDQIIVAKLQQEMFKRYESSTSEKNNFFVNCHGNKFGDVYCI